MKVTCVLPKSTGPVAVDGGEFKHGSLLPCVRSHLLHQACQLLQRRVHPVQQKIKEKLRRKASKAEGGKLRCNNYELRLVKNSHEMKWSTGIIAIQVCI